MTRSFDLLLLLYCICIIIHCCSGKYENFTDSYRSPIPKIIHRIWMVFHSNFTYGLPDKYIRADKLLKDIHQDWTFFEWTDKKVLNFVARNYPELLPLYISFEYPIMRHDFSRYLILRHYGGVFIQHSFYFRWHMAPLLGEAELVLPYKFDQQRTYGTILDKRKNELNNNFMATVPRHKFWDFLIKQIIHTNATKKSVDLPDKVMGITGPFILTKSLLLYQRKFHDDSIRLVPNKYLMPFYVNEKFDYDIRHNCTFPRNPNHCFNLFPEAYAYTTWSSSWTKRFRWIGVNTTDIINVSYPFDQLIIINSNKIPDRWVQISKDLFNMDMKFIRFEAINGNKVKIRDPVTRRQFTGIDVKKKNFKMFPKNSYDILCENEDQSFQFRLDISNINSNNSPLTVEDIGNWCTKLLLRELIIINQWNRTLIIHENFHVNWANFPAKLNQFMNALPYPFDLAYLYNPLSFSKSGAKRFNGVVKVFNPTSKVEEDWPYVISLLGAMKLNQHTKFAGTVDDHLRHFLQGTIKPPIPFHIYGAAHNFSAKHHSEYYKQRDELKNSTMIIESCRLLKPFSNKGNNKNHKNSPKQYDCTRKFPIDQVYIILKPENQRPIDFSMNKYAIMIQELENLQFPKIIFITPDPNIQIISTIQKNLSYSSSVATTLTRYLAKDISMNDLKLHQLYTIQCNPSAITPVQFPFIFQQENFLLYPELKRRCTFFRIWKHARIQQSRNILILSGENYLPTSNLYEKWNKLLFKLPIHFDIAHLPLSMNQMNKFPQAAIYSKKAIQLLSMSNMKSISSDPQQIHEIPPLLYFGCFPYELDDEEDEEVVVKDNAVGIIDNTDNNTGNNHNESAVDYSSNHKKYGKSISTSSSSSSSSNERPIECEKMRRLLKIYYSFEPLFLPH